MSATGPARREDDKKKIRNAAPPGPAFARAQAGRQSNAAVRGENRRLLNILKTLTDDEHGPVGRMLYDRWRATGCRVAVDREMTARATHTSFVYPPRPGHSSYANIIHLGAAAVGNRQSQFSALIHECTHAVQVGTTAALHASPFNAATAIALCPRDFVMACERAEQDAYARQAWLNSLLTAQRGICTANSAADPVPVATLAALRRQTPDILDTLRRAAAMMLGRTGFHSAGGTSVSLADSYHEQALDAYRRILETRRKDGAPALQFVRMEDCDILAIGRSFGPSLFGDGDTVLPAFTKKPALSPKNQALLDSLNAALGITDEDDLPTLGEALAARGMTRESFLAASAAQAPRAAGPKPPAP